ncbi:DsbA family protein [Ruegeria sp. ANG-S4]|uniref:DsbA family protein n=1 Tax=Ruegeria sp. ANG-S4 TaxID=1577904 RepID=UPI000689DE13|nr:DsbA family protein [Ruegeria sp. ANG-S4]
MRKTISLLLAVGLSIPFAAVAPNGAAAQSDADIITLVTDQGEIDARIIREADAPGAALIIGLHGYGMDAKQIESLVNVEPNTDHSFVALNAPVPVEGGGGAWFPLDDSSGSIVVDLDDVRLGSDTVADATLALVTETGADPAQVYIVGFSQGASMALGLALTHPDLAAGYIAFAGGLPREVRAEDWTVEGGAPVLLGYGTRDARYSAEELDATVAALSDAGLSVQLETFPVPHVVSSAGRRAITAWIDDRIAGVPVPQIRPLPIAATAAPDTDAAPETVIAEALVAADARGGYFGNPEGDLVIYKFFDFNCSICRIAHRQMDRFLSQMPDNTRVVAVDVPLLGPGSREAAALTFSIAKPEDYNRAYHALMDGRGQMTGARALRELESIGIAVGIADTEAAIDAYQNDMRVNTAAMRALGLVGTPGFFVRLPDGREQMFTGWDAQAIAAFVGLTLK